MILQSIIEWKRPADEMPDDEITVLLAFADGDVTLGYHDGCWRNMEGLPYGTKDEPRAWADVPEAPKAICENPRNLRKETEGK